MLLYFLVYILYIYIYRILPYITCTKYDFNIPILVWWSLKLLNHVEQVLEIQNLIATVANGWFFRIIYICVYIYIWCHTVNDGKCNGLDWHTLW